MPLVVVPLLSIGLLLLDQQPHNRQKELVLVLDLLMLLLMMQLALLLPFMLLPFRIVGQLDQDQNPL